jgi:hypothetical protein
MATPPDFSVAQVLTAAHMNAVGLWLVKTQTIGTAVSSVTVSDAFSADFDNYKIMIAGGASSTNAGLTLQLGSTTTGYYSGSLLVTYSTAAVTGSADNNAANWSQTGRANTTSLSMNIDLISPFLAEQTFMHGPGAISTSTSRMLSGILDNTTSYTSFIVAPASGTLTGGTIRVYGYRN